MTMDLEKIKLILMCCIMYYFMVTVVGLVFRGSVNSNKTLEVPFTTLTAVMLFIACLCGVSLLAPSLAAEGINRTGQVLALGFGFAIIILVVVAWGTAFINNLYYPD